MLKRNLYEKLLNLLPDKHIKCPKCSTVTDFKRGDARISRRKYGGEFCPKCGNSLRNLKRRQSNA